MSKDYSFNVMPSVSISRSRFSRNSQHKTTFNLGDLIPIYCDEVLPGDTRSLDIASIVRMSTPIAPIMDNIYLDIFAFFVPNRIVWDHWKEFMGENSVSAGIPTSVYTIPSLDTANPSKTISFASGSYADYFGLPVSTISVTYDKISCLPFRGLFKIYNRWFRDENLIAPLAVDTGDLGAVLVNGVGTGNSAIANANGILKVSKLPDYFTKSLPYAQKGNAVSIPLGTNAPVISGSSIHKMGGDIILGHNGNAYASAQTLGVLATGHMSTIVNSPSVSTQVTTDSSNLIVDLSNATAATINQLRYAFQLQKFLEKDSLYGSRYWEILASHFSITAPDSTLQDPEYLGGSRININIDQVLATAAGSNGAGTPSTSVLGQPGANSVTAYKGSLFTKSFVEHGHIIIVACARHDLTYTQGINRMWSRQSRYDFYWPVFANLGAQEVKNKEIYAQGTSADEGTFGYQESWAEYRYKPSIATSLMRPGVTGNLGFWTLAENFGSLPTLSQSFIEQDRSNISRALVSGSTGPDFVADFYFRDIAVRPMPTYSIPGLIDHH